MTHEGMQFPRYSVIGTRICSRCDHWSEDPATRPMGECRALPPQLHVELVPNALPWQSPVKVTKLYPPVHAGELGCRALYRRRTSEANAEDRVRRDRYLHELNQAALAAKSENAAGSAEQTEGEPNGEA